MTYDLVISFVDHQRPSVALTIDGYMLNDGMVNYHVGGGPHASWKGIRMSKIEEYSITPHAEPPGPAGNGH